MGGAGWGWGVGARRVGGGGAGKLYLTLHCQPQNDFCVGKGKGVC